MARFPIIEKRPMNLTAHRAVKWGVACQCLQKTLEFALCAALSFTGFMANA
ncbi:hypothetical protein GCE9029_02576 [Grimontia celer]|uniref:Uncharacterized protein n=1 Tax=Grimontia celer TaxID=1796497 RepID=A0A128F3M9_9GAMM|nr:hypothetical protein GCE9029_02576 [Grimontia celer]